VPRGDFDLSFPLATAIETWNPPRGAGALIKACFADPGCSDRFIHELADVKGAADGLDVPAEVSARAAALAPLINSDPRRESNAGATSAAQGRIVSLLAAHDGAVDELLATHPLTMHAPAITAAPPAVTTATTASFEFGLDDAEGVSGFECSLDGAAFAACASPAAYDGLASGEHHFEVRAVNDGDTPSPVAARDWTVGTVAVPKYALTVTRTGNGSGTVSANPTGPTYNAGTMVTLTATPSTGSAFGGWTGCDSVSIAGDCIVTMDAAKAVTAAFALVQPSKHALTINKTGDGSGSVSADPPGPQYDEGTEVTLMATPAAGSTFAGWTGCDSVSIAGDCIVAMDEAKTVTAAFALIKQPGIVGWIKAPEKGKVRRGDNAVVAVKVKNAGDGFLTTQLDVYSSNERVKVKKEALAVKARPGEVDVIRAKVKATRKARGAARVTFTADGEKAVTRLVVKKR
jgi:hypothetical protein